MEIAPAPPSECWNRVLRTQFDNEQFTSFLVTVDGKNYLITAGHCIESASEMGTEISLLVHTDANSSQWDRLPVTLVGRNDDEVVDLAVFRLNGIDDRSWPDPALGYSHEPEKTIVAGQDVIYFGYPAVKAFPYTNALPGSSHPIPVLRKGALMTAQSGQYILDSLALRGFSGGPAYYQLGMSGPWTIAGVVTGYPIVEKEVGMRDSDLELFLQTDGNMTCCTPIERALDIIGTS